MVSVRAYIFDYSYKGRINHQVVFPPRFMFGFYIGEDDQIRFDGSNDPNLLEELVRAEKDHRKLPKQKNESRYEVPIEIVREIEKGIERGDSFSMLLSLAKLKEYEVEK